MQKIIEFANKVALNENADIPEINKITDDNINEIKDVVNGALQGTNAMGSIVVDDINCKNLLPNTIGTQIINDVTITRNNDGSLTLNGTASANITIYGYFDITLPAGTYTHSCQNNIPNGMYLSLNNISSTMIGTSGNTNNVTFTLSEDTNYTRYVLYIASGTIINNLTIYPMIEKGDSVSNYVSYKKLIKEQNGYVKESTTFYADDFKCRNIFDPSSMIELNGQVRRYSDGVIVNVSGYYGIKVPVSANTTYIISSNLVDRNKISNLCYFNGTTYISGEAFGSGSLSFTTPNNCNYITFALSNEYTWCQLEVGNEASTYTPYKNFDSTFTITQLLSDTSPSAGTSYSLNDNIENYKYIMIVMSSGALFPNSRREYIPVEQLQINNNDYRIGISLFQSATVYMFLDLSFDASNSIRCNTKTQGTTGWSPRLKVYGIK